MRKVLRTVGMLLLCGVLCCPTLDARGRNGGHDGGGSHNGRPSTGQQARPSRPGNSGHGHGNSGQPSRPSNAGNHNQGGQRPGNQGGNHNQGGQRPGNQGGNHNQGGQRPGNQGGNHNQGGQRPGNQGGNHNQGGQRPGNQGGNHNHGGQRPGNNHRPNTPPPTAHRPGHGNGHAYGHEHYYRPTPPSRPYLPPMRPYHRPKPPRHWRPVATWRPFRSVLGVAFGSAINVSLNLLLNSGYTIESYGPNAIYLNNVPMLNCYWPDATMYYNNGALTGSEFVYYTPYANSTRYDMVFNALCGSYGSPVSLVNNGGMITASWWGTGNQYISLTYGGQYAGNGTLGYYTTLTFGI